MEPSQGLTDDQSASCTVKNNKTLERETQWIIAVIVGGTTISIEHIVVPLIIVLCFLRSKNFFSSEYSFVLNFPQEGEKLQKFLQLLFKIII